MPLNFSHSFLFFALISLLAFSPPADALHVVIDAGHGGSDKGAVANNLTESHLTLQISKILAQTIGADPRFSYTLTRDKDIFLSLEERANMANKVGDVFISIHANSSNDKHTKGKEIYFQNQLPPDEESLFLASRENSSMQPAQNIERGTIPVLQKKKGLNPDIRLIVEDLNRNHALKMSGLFTEMLYHNWYDEKSNKHHSIRQAPFFVISNTDKPAVLIEVGYLTNLNEARKLSDPEYLKKIVVGIHQALISFKELIDKPLTKSLN